MNWNFLISFGVGLGIYLVAMLIWFGIKKYRNKKNFDKEKQDKESEGVNDEEK